MKLNMKYVCFFLLPKVSLYAILPSYFTLGTDDGHLDQAQPNMPVKLRRQILPPTCGPPPTELDNNISIAFENKSSST